MALGAEVPKYVLGGGLLTMVAGLRLLNKGLTTLYREDGLGLKVRGFMKLDSTEGEGGESSGRQPVREGPESMRNQESASGRSDKTSSSSTQPAVQLPCVSHVYLPNPQPETPGMLH